MCFLKCTLQEGVPEFPLYNIKGKHGEMDADMDAGAAPWRYASRARSMRVPCAFLARSSHFSAFRCFYIIAVNTRGTRSKRVNLPLL